MMQLIDVAVTEEGLLFQANVLEDQSYLTPRSQKTLVTMGKEELRKTINNNYGGRNYNIVF